MSERPSSTGPSIERQMARGAVWLIAMRWGVRLTGVVSTVLLARLLTPADYGIVAIATLILGVIEIFGETGQANAIVRHPNPSREHYDSAWTISLLIGFVLALIVLAATPLTITYFHEPRAAAVLEILALRTALSGFQNVGTVNFQRDLEFHKQFQMTVGATFIQFAVVIVAAFSLRNYWALVIGIMSKQAATIALSYVLDPYRPRLSWAKVPELFSFSFWVLWRNIGAYVSGEVDKIAIGGFAGAAEMGRYEVGRDIAMSPVTEATLPLIHTIFPGLAKVQGDKAKRRELFLTVLCWSALICTSTAIGVALVADDMADIVLGPKWDAVKPLIPWLALTAGISALTVPVYNAFESIGRAAFSARLAWLQVISLALIMFPVVFHFRYVEAVAIARFWITLAISPILFFALSRALHMPLRDLVFVLWRPFLAGFSMAVMVLAWNAEIAFTGLPRLLFDIVAGAMTFALSIMILWFVSGRPEGPEQVLWQYARKLFAMLPRWRASPPPL